MKTVITINSLPVGAPGGRFMKFLAKKLGGEVGYGQTADNPGYCCIIKDKLDDVVIGAALKEAKEKFCPWLRK